MTDVPLGEPEYDERRVGEIRATYLDPNVIQTHSAECWKWHLSCVVGELLRRLESQHAAYESERAAREEAERRVAELTAERDEAWRYQRQAESHLHTWRDLLR